MWHKLSLNDTVSRRARTCVSYTFSRPSRRHTRIGVKCACFAQTRFEAGQLFRIESPDRPLWLEVLPAKRNGKTKFLCAGELLEIKEDAFAHCGFYPKLSETWVRNSQPLLKALKYHRRSQQEEGALPSELLKKMNIDPVTLGSGNNNNPACTLKDFQESVMSAPSLWCDGTGPRDSPLDQQQQALLTAGELIAFLTGLRGVVLLQLNAKWEGISPAEQPLLRPFALQLLALASRDKEVVTFESIISEGVASSVVLSAKKQPFRAWATHLAQNRVQAALVADSPYYKLLIGRILGYKLGNIQHHIGAQLDASVRDMVENDLKALSGASPKLPWR